MSCNLWMCGLQPESKRFASCEGYSRKNCGSGDSVGVREVHFVILRLVGCAVVVSDGRRKTNIVGS